MTVTLSSPVVERYRRFSLYNSPYPAHDRGCAVDLYPETNDGLSPISGEVLDTKSVRAPPKPYAVEADHLIVVAVDEANSPGVRFDGGERTGDGDHESDYVARILHVDPAVEPGQYVEAGESLGEMVRSGFFGQWVDNHVHLGFRRADQNAYRAGGSLPLTLDAPVEPLGWDGTGTVVEVGETYVLLDAPSHPDPGAYFAGIAADDGRVLDGGLAHYTGGGVLTGDGVPTGERALTGGRTGREAADAPLSFLDFPVGSVAGRDVRWNSFDVVADGERATGLSLFLAQDSAFGAKLVFHEGHAFAVGDDVRVELVSSDDPIRLG
ncbi:M23 family metallopeptidase [Haloprofundus salinisoli]|uniref:M23 family metallopeptidase n=1 Tax=Haloprofundus salinisoli TaxID=2876193 RepID=UPI001CCA5097|nr:M23 family metallopeptidase [Haloprofundus salinisoli]